MAIRFYWAGRISYVFAVHTLILGLALLTCHVSDAVAWTGRDALGVTEPQRGSFVQLVAGQEYITAKNNDSWQALGSDLALDKERGVSLPQENISHNDSDSGNKNEDATENDIYDMYDNFQDMDSMLTEDAATGNYSYKERTEDSLLIVGVVVDDIVLDDGFLIYMDGENIIVPLQYLSNLLGFPIEVNTETGTANGWFIKEKNSFELKKPYKFVTIRGKKQNIASGEIVENHEDDIYISKELIEKWLPIELNFNFQDLTIYLTTSEELPFQARAKRLKKWENIKKQTSRSGVVKIDKDVIRLPYKKLSLPTIQVNQSMNIRESTDGSKLQNSTTSVTLQGDLLGMDMRADIGFNQATDGSSQMQRSEILLSKEDFEGKIGGPLKATQLAIGDISTYQFPLAGGNRKGRGIKLSNAPVSFVRNPNEHIVEGYAPAGWDVEIYQDDRLLDFTRISDDGYYRFEALPLKTGFNLFRIVMYGPNGEQREEFERLYLGNNMIDAGKFIYEMNAVQSNTPLIDLRKKKAPKTDPTFSFLGEYGLSKNLSISGGYYTAPATDEENLNGVMMGIRGSGENSFSQVNIFRNRDGAVSVGLDVRGNLGKNTSWGAGHVRHRKYAKDIKRVEKESYIRFAQNIAMKKLPKFSYSIDLKRRLIDTGTRETIISNRFSTNFLGLSLTNNIDHITRDNSNYKQILGKLTLYRKSPIGIFRSNINYSLDRPAKIDNATLQWQKTLSEKLALNALIDTSFGSNPVTTFSGGIDIKQDKYRLGITGSLSDKGDRRLGMNLAYNFIPQSLHGDYKITSESVNNGHIMLKPFIDSNNDGMFTKGEELLAGIKFKNMLRGTKTTSNEKGMAVLAGLAPNAVNKITIEQDSLPDIYLTPLKAETKILGRRGINGPIYVPIQQLGEISGIVTVLNDMTGKEVELADLPIQLLNQKGEIVAKTTTEYDGFYSFPSLPIGLYDMFFPTLKALDMQYSGEGTGPRFELSSDEPEIYDGDVVMKHHRLDGGADSAGNSEDDSAGEDFKEKTGQKGKKLGFIGIVPKATNVKD